MTEGKCGDCRAWNKTEFGGPADQGECRMNPPTPTSAYVASYPSIRGSFDACMQMQPKEEITVGDLLDAMHKTDETPDEEEATGVFKMPPLDDGQDLAGESMPEKPKPTAPVENSLLENQEDFVMDHDLTSMVDNQITCGMHPKRSGLGKNRPKVECETCLAIWDFNKAHGLTG